MGVTYIPDTSGENIARIGEAISDFIDPNRRLKAQMRALLASNPKLAQQVADLEHDNPGTLKAMGLGGSVEKAVKQISPSYESQINAIIGPQAVKEATKPEQAKRVVQKMLTGETPEDVVAGQGKEMIAGAFNDYIKNNPEALQAVSQLPVVKAQLETLQAETTKGALGRQNKILQSSQYTPESIDLRGDAKKFFDGTLKPDKATFYNAYDPALKTAWDQALDAEKFNREADLRTKLANLRENPRDNYDKLLMGQAAVRQRQTNVGTPEGYFYYWNHRLMPGGSGKVPSQEELAAIDAGEKASTVAEKNQQLGDINKTILATTAAISKATEPSQKAALVDDLNNSFLQKSQLGAPPIRAVYGPKTGFQKWVGKWVPFANPQQVYYVDKDGNIYDDPMLAELGQKPLGKSTENGAALTIANTIINDTRANDPAKRAIALDKIKNDPQASKYYDRVKEIVDSTFAARK